MIYYTYMYDIVQCVKRIKIESMSTDVRNTFDSR